MMGDYEKLNSMGQEELRAFVRYVCDAYPTLMKELASLETHEKRQAFFRDSSDKSPYSNTTDPYQMELPFEEEVNKAQQ